MSIPPTEPADAAVPQPEPDLQPSVPPLSGPSDAGSLPAGPSEDAAAKRTERPHPLTPLIRGWVVLLAIALGGGREFLNSAAEDRPLPPVQLIIAIVAAVALGAVVIGLASWLTTRFVIDADELRIETGILLRRSRRIAFDKVASIDVLQPLAARIFGLAELEIDIGSDQRLKLRYLSRSRAYSLRDYLLSRAHGHRAEISEVTTAALELTDLQEQDEVLLRLTPDRIVLGAVTSNEFVGLVVTVVVAIAAVATASVWLPELISGGRGIFGVSFAVIALVLSGLSGIVGFITRRITGQFNFTLSRRPSGLRVSRGLTNLTSQSVPARRIQAVRLSQSLLWRGRGWYRVEVDVLGQRMRNEEDTRAATSSVLLPVADAGEVRMVLAQLWPDADYSTVPLHPAPFRARWRHPVTGPFLAFGHDDDLVVSRHGWLERRWDLVPHARVQSVRVSQGPVSRRLGLADLAFHTAGSRLNTRARGMDAHHVLERQAELIELAQAHRPDITVTGNGDGSYSRSSDAQGQTVADNGTVPINRQAAGPDALRADQAVETISSTE